MTLARSENKETVREMERHRGDGKRPRGTRGPKGAQGGTEGQTCQSLLNLQSGQGLTPPPRAEGQASITQLALVIGCTPFTTGVLSVSPPWQY